MRVTYKNRITEQILNAITEADLNHQVIENIYLQTSEFNEYLRLIQVSKDCYHIPVLLEHLGIKLVETP